MGIKRQKQQQHRYSFVGCLEVGVCDIPLTCGSSYAGQTKLCVKA
ncbi:hypothetical protein ANAPC5_01393 [Anaplasma phagocytophilum]|nr:hypothetical protein ANAPC5_01393 [Anaplasma phagocytophilum]